MLVFYFALFTCTLCAVSRDVMEFPLASSVRYHLPPHLARMANCDTHAAGPRCCPLPTYPPGRGELIPFKPESDDSENFGVQRCLRATSCEAPGPNLKKLGPCMPWQHSRLAMVLMRDKSISAYAQHTEAVNAVWAARWNYSLIVVELAQDVPCERSISWERVEIVRRHLSNHDYVFFVDADIIVVEHERPWLEEILEKNKHADIIVCKDSGFVMPDVKRGIGGASFANFGAFILRNTKWTHAFIETWWKLGDIFPIYGFSDPHEQAAFGDYYGRKIDEGDTEWLSHVAVLETTSFNSLDPFYVTHKKGMPIIHTTMRLPRSRETLFARVHAGLCARDENLYISNEWMTDLICKDSANDAKERPKNAEAQMIHSGCLQQKEMHEEALKYIERGVKNRPDDIYYRSSFGAALEKVGRLEEALVQYNLAIQGPVQMQSIVRRRAALLVKLGRADEALKAVEERIEGEPDPFLTLFQMGSDLLKERKNIEKAAELLERACKVDPKATPAALNLGIAYQFLKNWPKAVKMFDRVLKMENTEQNEHERALLSKARVQASMNDPSEAKKTLKLFRKRFPNSPFRTHAKELEEKL